MERNENMKQPKITVMGSFVVDLTSKTPHLPIPGETVKGTFFKMGPGGKGSNQAVAASRVGVEVNMITKLGQDEFGDMAWKNFIKEGICTDYIYKDKKHTTGTALIMVDENTSENMILVVPGACQHITKEEVRRAKDKIIESDILLTQLETNIEAIDEVIHIAHEANVLTILNPAPVQTLDDNLLKKIDIITPNEVEASILTGIQIKDIEDVKRAVDVFKQKGVKNVIITLGKKGVYVSTQDNEELIPSYLVEVVDTTGAGDAFNGGLAYALANGQNIWEAAAFGNAVAALAVTKFGTAPAMPYKDEVEKFMNQRM